jgi:adenylate cyclase
MGTTVPLVVLHVDLVGSTDLSMNLPLKRLVPIIQAFTQEMSLVIEAYGGYVFKYVGDAILSFFFKKKMIYIFLVLMQLVALILW